MRRLSYNPARPGSFTRIQSRLTTEFIPRDDGKKHYFCLATITDQIALTLSKRLQGSLDISNDTH